jgi:hypothetical protein
MYKTLTTFFLIVVYADYHTLSSSDKCDRDNPALALFKYDKNKPQRLSFLAGVNVNTGHMEEWCIRKYYASTVQVAPKCELESVSPYWVGEAFFHEVF